MSVSYTQRKVATRSLACAPRTRLVSLFSGFTAEALSFARPLVRTMVYTASIPATRSDSSNRKKASALTPVSCSWCCSQYLAYASVKLPATDAKGVSASCESVEKETKGEEENSRAYSETHSVHAWLTWSSTGC